MKDKYKRIIIAVIMLLLIGLIVSIIIGGKSFERQYEKLNGKMSSDGKKYPEVNIESDDIIKNTTVSDILSIFSSKKNAVIYFGSPKCIYCRSVVQVLLDTASDTSLDTIYYFDTENNKKDINKILNVLDDEIVLDSENNKTLPEPLVIFVSRGNIVSYRIGTLSSHKDPYQKLSDSQVDGLSEIYNYGIRDALGVK